MGRIIGLFEYPRNSSDHHEHMGWHCGSQSHPLDPKAVLWTRIAAFAHEFSYDYSYLVHFIEVMNAHSGWFFDKSYYVPFPVPTYTEYLTILRFRESELKRIISSASTADALFEELESEGKTAGTFDPILHRRCSSWDWPRAWGQSGWNQDLPGGGFFYGKDDEALQRLQQLASTASAIAKYDRCASPDRHSSIMLCELVKKQSLWIWSSLRSAHLHESKIGEESVTDFFVLGLNKASKGAYYINSFTRPKENVTGADWELWFTGPTKKWIGLRIQAKIISIDAKRYAQLHYKRKNGTYQIDQLVTDAKKHKATPLYCLYSNWNSAEACKIHWPCGTVKRNIRLFGASILPIASVQAMKAVNDDSLKSVAKHLSPLHCLFCCQGYAQGDLPTRAYGFLRARGYIEEGSGLLLDEPPYYVSQMLCGTLEGDLIDVPDENLRRVTIIRETAGDAGDERALRR